MKRRTHVFDNAASLGAFAADLIRSVRQLRVLGVATGDSPLPLYESLASAPPDLADTSVFALDEYIGLDQSHPASYHSVVDRLITQPLGLDPASVLVPDGSAADPAAAAAEFDSRLTQSGGADVQILGIGRNGHIGFNEPGSDFLGRTRVVQLSEVTRVDNARFFASPDEVPTHAITQGIATIMTARRIVLIARGESKAEAIERLLSGDTTPLFPASVLRDHPDVTLLLDQAAASRIEGSGERFLSRRHAWVSGTEFSEPAAGGGGRWPARLDAT